MTTTPYCSLLLLWEKRSVFVGTIKEKIDVSTGASTLMLGLDKPFSFITPSMDKAIECRSALIPAGTPVVVDTQGGFFFNCTLGPDGADLHRLSQSMTKKEEAIYYNFHAEQDYIKTVLSICTPPLDSKTIQEALNEFFVINQSAETGPILPHGYTDDTRIKQVLNVIQENITENISLIKLAKLVNLSPAYLSELFKVVTGLPMRRYRLWHRVYLTVEEVGLGKNFTDAALFAGFTDSSHFIRTFRSMIGVTPSAIFSQGMPLKMMVADTEPLLTSSQTLTNSQESVL